MEALVDSKQAQQVRRNLVCCGAASLLLEEGVEVVGFTKNRALVDVKCLYKGFKMEQPPCKLQIGVSDCSSRVCVGDEEAKNIWGPAQVPYPWLI